VSVRDIGGWLCDCLRVTIPSAGWADIVGGVTRDDLAVWDQEFRDVCARLDGLFYRTDSRAHARHYVRGLIAPLERKNGWTIAEYSGTSEPKALQRLLNLSPWDADEARDLVRVYAMEHFADPRGVLIADPTGFAKKGTSQQVSNVSIRERWAGFTTARSACSWHTLIPVVIGC
jgi:hypothetical protein